MWTRIQMSCGPTSGYTLIPRLIFGCHLCCALRSHVRVQAEEGPYCCCLMPMSVRMDLRNAFTSKPIRSAWKDHSHENPVPLPLSFSARSGFHRHRFDMQLKAVCKILIVYNYSALFVRWIAPRPDKTHVFCILSSQQGFRRTNCWTKRWQAISKQPLWTAVLTLTLARNNKIQLTSQSPFFNTGFGLDSQSLGRWACRSVRLNTYFWTWSVLDLPRLDPTLVGILADRYKRKSSQVSKKE